MSPITTLATIGDASFKALQILRDPLRYGGGSGPITGGPWSDMLGSIGRYLGTTETYDVAANAGDPAANSLVCALQRMQINAFCEAPPVVQTRNKLGHWDYDIDHRVLDLLYQPNDWWDASTLFGAWLIDRNFKGNAYGYILRNTVVGANGLFEPNGIIWLPAGQTWPYWNDGDFITGYRYRPLNSTETIELRREDVIHFRAEELDASGRIGISRLQSLAPELCVDKEDSLYNATMAHNLGIPGIIMSPKEATMETTNIGMEAADKIKNEFQSRFTGAKRGQPLILTEPWDYFVPNFKPSELMTAAASKKADARICMAFSISPAIAGSLLGLEEANHASLKEYSESFYEMAIIPIWRQMGSELTKFLLWNFEPNTRYGRPRRDKRIYFDIREVRALAQDRFEQAQQEVELFRWGLTTRGEGRERIGLDRGNDPEKYYTDIAFGQGQGVVQPNLPSGGGPSRNGGNNLTDGNNPASAANSGKGIQLLDPATVPLLGRNGHGG